jgi:hypothetical protein
MENTLTEFIKVQTIRSSDNLELELNDSSIETKKGAGFGKFTRKKVFWYNVSIITFDLFVSKQFY